jgi:hypothetical protein
MHVAGGRYPVREVIDGLLLIDECGEHADWVRRLVFMPLWTLGDRGGFS